MNIHEYQRTTEASVGLSRSIKNFAEALALDIPKGSPVREKLIEARNRILETPGGEVRSIKTMEDYRLVAMWVGIPVNGDQFDWIDGASFTLHKEAYEMNWSADKFRTEYAKGGLDVVTLRTLRGKQVHGFDVTPVKDKNEAFRDAASKIINMLTALDDGEWEMDSDTSMIAHFLSRFIIDRSAITITDTDNLIDDITAYLAEQDAT